MYMWNCALWF
uniref:Uncharacterized protein n=1 Tax=Arundo donax TaxID=35708 RepID=A0A0A9FJA3_ARUDO